MAASSEPGGALSDLGMTHSSTSLQSILNGKYAAAEKLMSLRHPDRERLFNLFEEIEVHTEELILALESEHPVNSDMVENVRCSKREFDSHRAEWLRKISDKNNCDSSSSIGTISNASSRSSVRRRAAEAKRASAKLELEQLSEREQEQKELLSLEQRALELKAKHAKSEARRRLEAAEVELNVWSEINDDGHLSSRLAPTSGQFDINAKSDEQSCLHVSKPRGKSPLSFITSTSLQTLLSSVPVCVSEPPSLTFSNQFPQSSHYVTRSSYSGHNYPDFHSDIASLPQAISKSKSSDFSFTATQPHLVLSQQTLTAVTDSFAQSQFAQPCNSVPEKAPYKPPTGFKNYIAQPHSSFRPSVVWSQVSTNVSTTSGSSSQVATAPVSTQFPISEYSSSSSDTFSFSVQPPSNFVQLASLRSSTLNFPKSEYLSTSSQSAFLPYGATACLEQTEHVPAYHPDRRQNQSCTAQQPCSVYASTRQPLGPAAYEFLAPRPTVRPLYHDQPVYFDDRFVPKPELPKFDGNPLNYRNFMLNFETHIESRFRDPKILLCLLLQHCDRKIRDRIQHFSDKGISGYRMARDRLEREFGQPCIIAEACEQRLKGSSAVKSNDPESLKEFSELLEKTLISLEDIHYYGSINSLDTMTHLINKLPYDMRKGWVKESLAIQQRTSKVAEFSDFVKFVEREAEAANSLYGRRLFTSQSKLRSTSKPQKSNATFFATSVASVSNKPHNWERLISKCYYCSKSDHKLSTCSQFIESSVSDRTKFVRSKRLCFKCFSSNHRTFQCKREKYCAIQGCKGTFHHTLLHIQSKDAPLAPNSSVAASFVLPLIPFLV